MLSRLAPAIVRRRRLVLLVALLAVVLAGAIGGGVADHLTTGGFEDPAARAPAPPSTSPTRSARASPTSCSS